MARATKVKASISPHMLAQIGKLAGHAVGLPIRALSKDPKVDKWAKEIPEKVYGGVRGFFDQEYHDYGSGGSLHNRNKELREAFMGKTLLKPRAPISKNFFAQADEIAQKNMAGIEVYSKYKNVGTAQNQKNWYQASKLFYDMNKHDLARIDARALEMIKERPPQMRKGYSKDYSTGVPNWSMGERPFRGPLIETEAGAKAAALADKSGETKWEDLVGQEFYWWPEMPGLQPDPSTRDQDEIGTRGNAWERFREKKEDPFPGEERNESLLNDPDHDQMRKEFSRMQQPRIPSSTQEGTGLETSTTGYETPPLSIFGNVPGAIPTTDSSVVTQPEKKPPLENLENLTGISEEISFPEFAVRQPESGTGTVLPVEREQQMAFADNVGGVISDAPAYAGWKMGEQYAQVGDIPVPTEAAMAPVPEDLRKMISRYHTEHLDNLDQNAEQFMYREELPEEFAGHAQEYKTDYNITDELREKLKDPTSTISQNANNHLSALLTQEAYAAERHAQAREERDIIYGREVKENISGSWTRWHEKNNEVAYWQGLHNQLGARIDRGEPINFLFTAMRDGYVTSRPEKGWVTKEGDVRLPTRTALEKKTTEEKHVDPASGDEYIVTRGYFIDPEDGSQKYGIVGARPSSARSKVSILDDKEARAKALSQLEGTKSLYNKISTNYGNLVRSLGDLSRREEKGHVGIAGQIQQWVKFQQATGWTHASQATSGQFLNTMLTGGNVPFFSRTDEEENYFDSFVAILTEIRNMMDEARISNEDAVRVMTSLGDPKATKVSLLQKQLQSTLEYLSAKIWLGIDRQVADLSDPAEAEARATGLADLYGVPKYPMFLFPANDKKYRDKGPVGQNFRATLRQARARQDRWWREGRLREEPRPFWGNTDDTYRDGYLYNESDPFLDPAPYANRIVEKFRIKTDKRMGGRTIQEQKEHLFNSPKRTLRDNSPGNIIEQRLQGAVDDIIGRTPE
jgi:hypothetical protein